MMEVPDAEMDVLSALCRAGEATARELREAIDSFRPMAHGSVLTLLGRLEAKDLVTKRKGEVGKAFVYRPTAAGRRAIRPVVKGLVRRIFGGDRAHFVATLYDGAAPAPQELRELEQLVEKLRKKQKKR